MKMAYVLIGVVVGAGAVGLMKEFVGSSSASNAPVSAVAAKEATTPARGTPEAPAADVLEGEVLEGIDVPNYSYYRIGKKDEAGTWVAVPSATLKVGDHARVGGATKMENFASAKLKRTFPVIYFGTLQDGAAGASPHKSSDPHAMGATPGAIPADHPVTGGNPHQGIPQEPSAPVKAVDRAQGANGKTVAEVIGQRLTLAGKRVKIHATVVKSMPGILGRTYLHLRDGSGDASAGTHDLTVTTEATPAVGDTVILEGVVAIDRDIGSGYKFSTLLEDAKIIN